MHFHEVNTGLPEADSDSGDANHLTPLTIYLDVDGDGRDDVVNFNSSFPTSGADNATNTARIAFNRLNDPTKAPSAPGSPFAGYVPGATWQGNPFGIAIPIDYDQDGRMDVLLEDNNSFTFDTGSAGQIRVLLSDGTKLQSPQTIGVTRGPGVPHLADVNGDGTLDIVQCLGLSNSDWEVRLWNGVDSTGAPVPPYQTAKLITDFKGFPCTQNPVWAPFADVIDGIVTLDVNGDGAKDIMVADGQDLGQSKYWVVSYDSKTSSFRPRVDSGLRYGDLTGFRVIDINGDGLDDIISLGTNQISQQPNAALTLFLSDGTGAFRRIDNAGPKTGATGGFVFAQSVVADMDSDGRMDILIAATDDDPSNPHWKVLSWRGTGDSAGLQVQQTDMPNHRQFADATTVGMLDGKKANSPMTTDGTTGTIFVYRNLADLPDLVLAIQDGNSASSTSPDVAPAVAVALEYAPLRDGTFPSATACSFPTSCVPGGKPIVERYVLGDVGGSSADGHVLTYYDARVDKLGRGWLGFNRITDLTDDLPGDQGNGVTLRNRVFDNKSYDRSAKRYPRAGLIQDQWIATEREPSAGENAVRCDVVKTHFDYQDVTQPRSNGTTTFSIVGVGQKVQQLTSLSDCVPSEDGTFQFFSVFSESVTTTVPTTDGLGNVHSVTTTTSGLGRSTSTTFEYGQDDRNTWLIGRPTKSTTQSSENVDGLTVVKTRIEQTHYDPLGRPDTETAAPLNDKHQLVTILGYDAFGNVTSSSSTGKDRGISVTRNACITYEGNEQTFPFASTNAQGQTSYVKYDSGLGAVSQTIDLNGLSTRWAYDRLGRVSREVRADGSETDLARSRVSVNDGGGDEIHTVLRVTDSGGRDEEVEYDGRGRPAKRRSFVVGHTGSDADRALESVQYTPRGDRVKSHQIPGVATPETFQYDELGRLRRRVAPDGATTLYTYQGATLTIRDPRNVTREETMDGAGRLVRVVEAKGAKNATTTYAYEPFDQVIRIVDPVGNTLADPTRHRTVRTFDDYGWLTAEDDPDRGHMVYDYNAFNELVYTQQGDVSIFTVDRDALGRPFQRTDIDGITSWTWDTETNGIGQLAFSASPLGGSKHYTYDQFGRAQSASTILGGETFTSSVDYCPSGRADCAAGLVDVVHYPSQAGPFAIKYGYTRGYLTSLADAVDPPDGSPRRTYWTWTTADARNRITDQTFGDGSQTHRNFDDKQDGVLTSLHTTSPVDGDLQDLSFTFDANRNMLSRIDHRADNRHSESFCHDELNRITDSAIDTTVSCGGGTKTHFAYDLDGNLQSQLGVGTYTYDPAHPHAVHTAGNLTPNGSAFGYDLRGNQTSRPDSTISYTMFDLPATVQRTDGTSLSFQYDAGMSRVAKTVGNETTIYAGDLYQRVTSAAGITHRYFVRSPERTVAVVTRQSPALDVTPIQSTHYVHVDHAGSLDVVTDDNGGAVAGSRRAYDPFGAHRDPDWSRAGPGALTSLDRQGFTGHEEDDELGLVNMGGRMYDPKVARFLTPDPIVRAPELGQGWNRYAYVMNNPINRIDPSGLEDDSILDLTNFAFWGEVTAYQYVSGNIGGGYVDPSNPAAGTVDSSVTYTVAYGYAYSDTALPVDEVIGSAGGPSQSASGGAASNALPAHPALAPVNQASGNKSTVQSDTLLPRNLVDPARLGGPQAYAGPPAPTREPLDPRAEQILKRYLPTLDFSKVDVVVNAKIYGTRASTSHALDNGRAVIYFPPGNYIFQEFYPPGIAADYPQSPIAAGYGILAHELVHAQQVLTIAGFAQQYSDEVLLHGQTSANRFEGIAFMIERIVATDIAAMRGEDAAPPPWPKGR